MNEWISVEDRLPEEDEWVLVGCEKYQMTSWGILMNGKFVNPDLDYNQIEFVSHWMSLPKPPKE